MSYVETQLDTHVPFQPMSDARAFRTALGRFTTGITVVTSMSQDQPIGITVNSFSSLSLKPALVMWSADKNSSRHDAFVQADSFAVHVLSSSQQDVCNAFVRSANGFDGLNLRFNKNNVPIIGGCLAVFECTRVALHDAGDHTIIVGEVTLAQERPGEPLIFVNGSIGAPGNAS